MPAIRSSYHDRIYDPKLLRETIKLTSNAAWEILQKTPYEAIAFRGSSGAALAFPVSARLNKPCIYVRKPTEQTHGKSIEGPNIVVKRYLIIDDFIGAGGTVREIQNALYPGLVCVGVLLYCRVKGSERVLRDAESVGLPVYGALPITEAAD